MPDKKVLLSTAIVLIRDMLRNVVLGRILLGSRSQSNLITEEMTQTLRLKRKRLNHKLCGVGYNTPRIYLCRVYSQSV